MEESRAKQIVDEARAAEFAGRNAAVAEGQRIHEELSDLNPYVEMYAKEVGPHIRNGGWRIGMLIALSVEAGAGQGSRNDLANNLARSGKVSSRAFARQAGISDPTVMKYLNAWNLAASDLTDELAIPSSDQLIPGQEFELGSDYTPELWKTYFKTPAGDPKNTFIALKNKLDSFEASLDFETAFADFDNQFDVSLDNLLESLERVEQKIDEGRSKAVALAKKNDFRIEYH